jgi:hypothetical protein
MKLDFLSSAVPPVCTSDTIQDLPRLCETMDNTERFIQRDIRVPYIDMFKFNS